ncbi:MAG: hypothetical protein CVU84_14620 [Firmicutes bacterium HGW-Firmicutes-1]|jgi:hypothetical protein|nr:MAG: hypothetical protein CVU84_14620 [Firmicutes bacterium HGW-Firmicutes-1]
MKNINCVDIIEIDSEVLLPFAYYLAGMYKNLTFNSAVPSLNTQHTKLIKESLDFLGIEYQTVMLQDKIEPVEWDKLCNKMCDSILHNLIEVYKELYPNQLLDLEVTKVKHEDLKDQPIIVGITEQGLEQALKGGILLGRTVVYINKLNAIADFFEISKMASSTILCFDEEFEVQQMKFILDQKTKAKNLVPIGFMYPFGQLNRENVITKAFIFNTYRKKAKLFNFYYPLEKQNASFKSEKFNFFIGNTQEEIKDYILKEAEFTFATPHSNGVDMSIGNVVLCAKKDYIKEEEDEINRVMPCFYSDSCNRLSQNRYYIGASEIKSKILFLYTCWGIVLKNGIYDVRTTLAYQFAKSVYSPILITTYAMSLLDRYAGPYIVDLYCMGKKIGEAIESYNNKHYEKYMDLNNVVVLFGDPEFKLEISSVINFNAILTETKKLSDFFREENTGKLCFHLFDKNFFNNLDFTDYVLNGTASLGMKYIQEDIDVLREKVRNLRMNASLLNNRMMQSKQFVYDYDKSIKQLSVAYKGFQVAWYEFYKTMVNNLGGYIRFQVDRYFSMPEEDKEGLHRECPYCKTCVKIEKKELQPHGLKRRLIECFNCATIFDGLDSFLWGEIKCEEEWRQGSMVKVSVEAYTKMSGEYCYLIGLIVEPFDKKKGLNMPATFKKGKIDLGKMDLNICLDELYIYDYIDLGCYHLNCIILVNEKIVFLRRPIYITRGNKEDDEKSIL